MYCPFCGHIETKVTDSRLAGEGRQIRRRRECLSCEERFTTFETAELVMPVVVKGDRNRESFDEAKLRAGMEKALEKRPVPREQLDEALSRITHKVRSLGDREVQSRAIGELVMDELQQLDEVAYVRFASVYRHFEDVEAFHEEIQRLRSQRPASQPVREIKRVLKREPGPNRDQLPLLPMESAGKTESSGATPGSGATETGAEKNPAATESADDGENEVAAGRSLATENK
ncbi:MAG: NrdR family transcriptional regulator [Gammaproteobacteria bacterium]|jgi:transcriptional repressor NrdR|nr:NrdR family transcriptional regulator [Gammaproteobacteria bacterium]